MNIDVLVERKTGFNVSGFSFVRHEPRLRKANWT